MHFSFNSEHKNSVFKRYFSNDNNDVVAYPLRACLLCGHTTNPSVHTCIELVISLRLGLGLGLGLGSAMWTHNNRSRLTCMELVISLRAESASCCLVDSSELCSAAFLSSSSTKPLASFNLATPAWQTANTNTEGRALHVLRVCKTSLFNGINNGECFYFADTQTYAGIWFGSGTMATFQHGAHL